MTRKDANDGDIIKFLRDAEVCFFHARGLHRLFKKRHMNNKQRHIKSCQYSYEENVVWFDYYYTYYTRSLANRAAKQVAVSSEELYNIHRLHMRDTRAWSKESFI